ncbi:MAG: sugar transferase [Clostridiales bacterium]|nr:sugar transferase [Clostridiales bacterium]
MSDANPVQATNARTDEAYNYYQNALTAEEKDRLKISPYYRPFRIEPDVIAGRKLGYRFIKRLLDVLISCLALIVAAPLILVFALMIMIEDPKAGPVFKQIRVGRNNKPFVMYKLRSMYADAEKRFDELAEQNEAQSKAFKMKNDPRVTKVGKLIRKYSIDECLQFVNVLKSDMSIVGPRPPLQREVEMYDEYDLQRLLIKPGLTCYWQVFPNRHEISFEDWVAMDMKYIIKRNVLVDFGLIMQTLYTVFSGKGD